MALDQAQANLILASMHGGTAYSTTGLIHVRLMTAAGSATANGTELTTSGGYTSGAGAPTIATWAAASAGSQATSAAVTVTNMPAATIPAIELWDSNATPKRIEFGNLTASKTTVSGDTLSFASGAITSALA